MNVTRESHRVLAYPDQPVVATFSVDGADGQPGEPGIPGYDGEDGSHVTGQPGHDGRAVPHVQADMPGGDAPQDMSQEGAHTPCDRRSAIVKGTLSWESGQFAASPSEYLTERANRHTAVPTVGRGVMNGGPGTFGWHGGAGHAGESMNLQLTGDIHRLTVSGTHSWSGSLTNGILKLSARGGNGGAGGAGGPGGAAGWGGHGGKGGKGGKGRNATVYAEHSGDGLQGGNGANGGDGADGGPGGPGGNGGAAGDGGIIEVSSDDPLTFSLLVYDVQAGTIGTPGAGGAGGAAGQGGRGGEGGDAGEGGDIVPKPQDPSGMCPPRTIGCDAMFGAKICYHCHVEYCWVCNRSKYGNSMPGAWTCAHCNKTVNAMEGFKGHSMNKGRAGNPGRDGQPGVAGPEGKAAPPAEDGRLLFRCGSVVSPVLYSISVDSYRVRDENGDSIFEPSSLIIIDNIRISNPGGMPLPAGALVYAAATEFGDLVPGDPLIVPEVMNGNHVVLQGELRIRAHAMPSATTEPFLSKAEMGVGTALVGRPWGKGMLFADVPIQYPVQLVDVYGPPAMDGRFPVAPGGTLCFNIDIKNISAGPLPYSAVSFSVLCDPGLSASAVTVHPASNPGFIPPAERSTMQVRLMMDSSVPLFVLKSFRLQLEYNGVCVQWTTRELKVSGTYDPSGEPKDVLLFVPPHVNLAEYRIWTHLLSSLGLTYDMWDIDGNFGVSIDKRTGARHDVTWVGRHAGRLLLMPGIDNQPITWLAAGDIVDHLNTVPVTNGAAGGGVCLFGVEATALTDAMLATSGEKRVFSSSEYASTFAPFTKSAETVTEADALQRADELVAKCAQSAAMSRFGIESDVREVRSSGPLSVCFGTVTVTAFPAPRSATARIVNVPIWLSRMPGRMRPQYTRTVWSELSGYSLEYVAQNENACRNAFNAHTDKYTIWDTAISDEPPVPEKFLLSTEPFDPTAVTDIPAPTRFSQAAMAIIAVMPAWAKLKLLIACHDTASTLPARMWTFSIANPSYVKGVATISFADAVGLALYNDIKQELACRVPGMPVLNELINLVERDSRFKIALSPPEFIPLIHILWGVLVRAMFATRQPSFFFGDAKNSREVFLAFHRRFKMHVFSGDYKAAKISKIVYEPLRSGAEAWARPPTQVKLRDMVLTLQYPSYGPCDIEIMERERAVRAGARVVAKSGRRSAKAAESGLGVGASMKGALKSMWRRRVGRK